MYLSDPTIRCGSPMHRFDAQDQRPTGWAPIAEGVTRGLGGSVAIVEGGAEMARGVYRVLYVAQ